MICSNCGTANEADARFCNACGTPLHAACPSCGAVNKPDARFCSNCGTALSPSTGPARATAVPASPQGVAERRLVTVLFADLVGFTPFAEERDAEDVRETLSNYFDMCSEIVTRYGGVIEKFIGDAVMAVWGAPVAHEDDAERAVRAALELVDAVRGLGSETQARAGVLTGEAAVTIGATNQGMVAGDLVNTCARLQSVAAPGTVLVGEATYRASSNSVAFEEVGDQALKGKQSPVPAWRAVRVVAERGGRNRAEGLETPFVGRADELRLLKDLFHATGREKRVRLVSVMGPAGIGKSRLAWEFLKYVDGVVEDSYWHSGRSPAYGEGVTFWALGEMVRGRCGLVESDDEPVTRQKVAEAVGTWVSDAGERDWIERALLALLGIESGMASDQLFAAWRTFFERIASAGTVALVFEDMHHADSGLLDFIDHMLEWSRGLPIYIVTLARPELLDRRSDWGAGKRNFTSIYLEPLGDAEMRELLAGLVPGLPESAVARIVERAAGVPLYAVETVRMLVAEGRLREEGGVYVPVGDLATLAVPDTLTALISSRLDSLEPTDRSLVHAAAVLGQSFSLAALAEVSGVAGPELEDRLKTLIRRELLIRQVDPRSSELGQYAFVQALIREVAYNTLSRKDRKARHLAAARHFEQLGSDELASALAGHYLAAHENATDGAEADALAAQARVALRAAADRAVALGAHDQAITFLEQAVRVTAAPAERAELLERAGHSASVAARHERAAELFRAAIELHSEAGNRAAAARATAALGWDLEHARHNAAALDLLSAAIERYGDLWPDPGVVDLKVSLARALVQLERPEEAVAVSDEALIAAEHANMPPTIARALVSKGGAYGSRGRLREGLALIRAGAELAREAGLTETLLRAVVVEGYYLGEIENRSALERYREGLALARRVGHRRMALQFIINLGYTGFLVGDWDDALREMDAALAEELGPSDRVWLMSNELIIRANRGEDVAGGLVELERLLESHGDPTLAFPTWDTRGNAALAAGRLGEASRFFRQVAEGQLAQGPAGHYQAARGALWAGDVAGVRDDLRAIDAAGVHGRVVDVRRTTLKAGICALEGQSREATKLYHEALEGWRALGMEWEEALTGIDMATVLDPAEADVEQVVKSTRAILERLGARPYLERLETAAARSPSSDASEPTEASAEPVTSASA